jgi:TolB protein
MIKSCLLRSVAVLSLLSISLASQAQLRIEISGVGANQIPIAIAKFADEEGAPHSPSNIIRSDLERSGAFRLIDAPEVIADNAQIQVANWKNKGADAVVVGRINKLANGRFELRYRLVDTLRGTELSSFVMTVQPQFLRFGAHKIANDIFYKLTGVPGAFATRIAYIVKSGTENRLEIADSDGESPIAVTRSTEPLISPSWSPDGTKLAYVSFERKKPIIFIQELANSKRIVLADFKGSNSAPAWSPDGKSLAMALSRDGQTQIYRIEADGSNVRRLTNSSGIDTEPRFAPDGQTIYFTSDRNGGPQIFRMNLDGSDVKRVTFTGTYNISPRISPDGKMLAYISRREGKFQLYVLDLINSQELRLSETGHDESPSFAPNGKYIMYATSTAVVSTDGRVRYNLSSKVGNIREPTWGPFTN